MSIIKLHEQLYFLRKQKGITQEELAQFLGVSNQSVSKWESGICSPDIILLPDIATYFSVTIDELLGYKSPNNFDDIYIKIRELFQETPEKECFDLAYKLSFILHEGVMTGGYKKYVPWNSEKIRIDDNDFYSWGFSACHETEGISVMKGNTVLISSNKYPRSISDNDIGILYRTLLPYTDRNNLYIMLGLYELTYNDPEKYVSVNEISEKCNISEDIVENSLKNFPVQIRILSSGDEIYRLENKQMYITAVLRIFLCF